MIRGMIRGRALGVIVACAVTLAATACAPRPDATCEGALREWLAAMDASENDVRRLKDAYALLGTETKKQLEARATQKSARLGRRIQPYELFAEGRVERAFEAASFTETKSGTKAVLRVAGASRSTSDLAKVRAAAEIRCTYEEQGARIELDGLADP